MPLSSPVPSVCCQDKQAVSLLGLHARLIDGITDIQPFRVMYNLSRLLINRSQKADPNISFSLEQ
jgi:hypothetical protein